MSQNLRLGLIVFVRLSKVEPGYADIYIRIAIEGRRSEISLKERIQMSSWDHSRQRLNPKTKGATFINKRIDFVCLEIRQKFRELAELNNNISAAKLRDAYLGIETKAPTHTLSELLSYYTTIWEGKLKKGGFKNYKTTISYIQTFVKRKFKTNEIPLNTIDLQFATDLEHYIRFNPQKNHDPCLGNGLGKHMQRFKRILNWATREIRWLKENPCEHYKAPLRKSKRQKMSMDDLLRMEKHQFEDSQLKYVSDLFIFSCYTGLSFVDILSLNGQHLEYDSNNVLWCRLYRIKSDELCRVPIIQKARLILNQYWDEQNRCTATIFRPISNQHANRCLKIMREIFAIQIPLTFHVARHTFAKTVALKNGVPLETVQMMLGHSKITTTQIYADVDEEKIIADVLRMESKLNKIE